MTGGTMTETLARYRIALAAIAAGTDDPAAVANAAITQETDPIAYLSELLEADPFKLSIQLADITTRQIRRQQDHSDKLRGKERDKTARWQMEIWEVNVRAAVVAGWVISPHWKEADVDGFSPAQTAWLSELFDAQYRAAVYIPKA
jgi:hypothetical protein